MSEEIKIPKKLIEVAIPLDEINKAARNEKSVPRKGHPQTLHYYWARRPLAAARATIFAQMVNDPGYERNIGRGVNVELAKKERSRLFKLISDLSQWENLNNVKLLKEANEEILKSWIETCQLNRNHTYADKLFDPKKPPAFLDPFAGGGTIPLEAQRLGLQSFASDLNPVAVLINKAMIEIPSRFNKMSPVGEVKEPVIAKFKLEVNETKAMGLAEDIRRFGNSVKNKAYKKLKDAYKPVDITPELVKERPDLKPYLGQQLKVIAWMWARSVKSPNPMYSDKDVPLASTFILNGSEKSGAYIEPEIIKNTISFKIRNGKITTKASKGTKAEGRGANFKCLFSGSVISGDYIKSEAKSGRMSKILMALVLESPKGRIYLSPTFEHENFAKKIKPTWSPDVEFFQEALGFRVGNYGITKWSGLFTERQLLSLSTFSDLIIEEIKIASSMYEKKYGVGDGKSLDEGGTGSLAYGQAIGVYLACALSRLASYSNTICFWNIKGGSVAQIFARQTIPISWDFIEINPLEKMSGNWDGAIEWVAEVVSKFSIEVKEGKVFNSDVIELTNSVPDNVVISTDPPYYDNIGYADLSDFFYQWLKRTLVGVYPILFSSVATPKIQELVATPARHGGKEEAESFFLEGMTKALLKIGAKSHPAIPVTIYYAFKQSETTDEYGTSSTGWETFLEAITKAGFTITGTWPLRTERDSGVKASKNFLASSILLVLRKKIGTPLTISRREFTRELNRTLPQALIDMTAGDEHSAVAPVDLSQAIIGPGMAIFSKYTAVLEADGKPMSVKTALQLINRFLAEDDYDHDTQFCLHWFEGYGWEKGKFGDADVLARAKGTSVDGLKNGGIIESGSGSLRLLRPNELPVDWNPETDSRLSIWEILHHMIKLLNSKGETGVGEILSKVGRYSETLKILAYRLYTLCERKGWAQDASQYNSLVLAWEGIENSAQSIGYSGTQFNLFNEEISLEVGNKIKKKNKRKEK